MFRLLTDENFNGDIVRALLLRVPDLDLVRVQDVGLAHVEDPEILAWAADHARIVLTHDRATMPDYAYQRMIAGEDMPGVFVLPDKMPIGQAIGELRLIIECSKPEEWDGLVVFLPL